MRAGLTGGGGAHPGESLGGECIPGGGDKVCTVSAGRTGRSPVGWRGISGQVGAVGLGAHSPPPRPPIPAMKLAALYPVVSLFGHTPMPDAVFTTSRCGSIL